MAPLPKSVTLTGGLASYQHRTSLFAPMLILICGCVGIDTCPGGASTTAPAYRVRWWRRGSRTFTPRKTRHSQVRYARVGRPRLSFSTRRLSIR